MENSDDLTGVILDGKYCVEHLLGRGGMGSVYAARHLQLDRTVAVKILKPQLVADNESAARFAREARASARLQHPNAVHVYDYGTSEGRTYLVMELLEGESLRELLKASGPLAPALILDLVRQAAAALASAHAEGIVHRDVKPENMIVRFDAARVPHLKIVDFGLAKLLATADTTQLTGPATIMGTPKYMAPELFTGDVIDERVDVYALGVVLYEMVTGRAPFEGSFSEIVGKHLHMEPPPIAGLRADLPAATEDVIRRVLAKSPAERTPTVAALSLELEAVLAPLADQPLDEAATIPPIPAAAAVGGDTMLASDTAETRVRRPAPVRIEVPERVEPGAARRATALRIAAIAVGASLAAFAIVAVLAWAMTGERAAEPQVDAPAAAALPEARAEVEGSRSAPPPSPRRPAAQAPAERPREVPAAQGKRKDEKKRGGRGHGKGKGKNH